MGACVSRRRTSLSVERVELGEANAFVEKHHSHHGPVQGHIFSLGVAKDGAIVGVAIVGRPVARGLQDGVTAEITRLCTDGTKNVATFLLGAATRACLALGFKRVITYILASESGSSLAGAGFKVVAEVRGRSWDTPSRPRVDKHPTQDKLRLERRA